MSKAIELPENQARALMRAARKEGVRIEVKIGGATILVFPDGGAKSKKQVDDDEDYRL